MDAKNGLSPDTAKEHNQAFNQTDDTWSFYLVQCEKII